MRKSLRTLALVGMIAATGATTLGCGSDNDNVTMRYDRTFYGEEPLPGIVGEQLITDAGEAYNTKYVEADHPFTPLVQILDGNVKRAEDGIGYVIDDELRIDPAFRVINPYVDGVPDLVIIQNPNSVIAQDHYYHVVPDFVEPSTYWDLGANSTIDAKIEYQHMISPSFAGIVDGVVKTRVTITRDTQLRQTPDEVRELERNFTTGDTMSLNVDVDADGDWDVRYRYNDKGARQDTTMSTEYAHKLLVETVSTTASRLQDEE
ncbi:MAG: hypothetical protein H6502_04545 [Candidatus Woesearchaeota archaeon]|nr:MAG: hypothetical protein H6502_04545 [Candidatus Woesearchaeota archaeon]